MYCSEKMSLFSQTVIKSEKRNGIFQYFNNEFTACGCSGSILFTVVSQKLMKNIMAWKIA